jgi:hypothetical protein
MPLIFTPHDLLVMQQLRAAFDPGGRCNPGKVFPPQAMGEGIQNTEFRIQNVGSGAGEPGK